MILIRYDLAAGTARLAQSTTIKVGADVPVHVIFSVAPGDVDQLQLALGTEAALSEVLAYMEFFVQENATTWTGLLDANDTRLADYMAGKSVATVQAELTCLIDGERRVTPNMPVTVQQRILSGPTTTEGGPTYLTAAQIQALVDAVPITSPGGAGTELQARAANGTFQGITGSSWTGTELTLPTITTGQIQGAGLQIVSTSGTVQFTASAIAIGAGDVVLRREAPGVLDLQNGTSPQAFRIYSSYIDAANCGFLEFTTSGGSTSIRLVDNGSVLVENLTIGEEGQKNLYLRGAEITLHASEPSGYSGGIRLYNLPTTEPMAAGTLWNDNGTLKVSAGIV